MKIVVIFPTIGESKYFFRKDVVICFVGVGITSTVYATMKAINEHQPDVIILGGIAGVYAGSKYMIGDCVLVGVENDADLGFFYPEGFRHISQMKFNSDLGVVSKIGSLYVKDNMPLPIAIANSANSAMSPFIESDGVDIESMEGFPFFYVCQNEGVPYFEVRAISNIVDPAHRDWNFDLAVRSLSEGLNKLIDYLIINEKN